MSDDRKQVDQQNATRSRRRRKRQRKNRKPGPIDLSAKFNRPLDYKVNGVEHRGSPVEIGLLSQVARAVGKGHMPSARIFLRSCELCGLIAAPTFKDDFPGRVRIPKDWDRDEWMEMFDRYGLPPWPGKRDGLVRDAEGNPVYD